jgi:hypothetical protein
MTKNFQLLAFLDFGFSLDPSMHGHSSTQLDFAFLLLPSAFSDSFVSLHLQVAQIPENRRKWISWQ